MQQQIEQAPEWLISTLGYGKTKSKTAAQPLNVDQDAATDRIKHYLTSEAPAAALGARNETAYRVAARVKDHGADQIATLNHLIDHWNDRNEPPMEYEELEHVVNSAFSYGHEQPGSAAPDAQFEPVTATPTDDTDESADSPHPFSKLNQQFAFVVAGGGHHVIWETKDDRDRFSLQHLSEATFHRMYAHTLMQADGDKLKPITQQWMNSKRRREFLNGIVFRPAQETPPGFYNLWRGFSVEPLPKDHKTASRASQAVQMWKEHAIQNVCNGDTGLADWLFAYFAHLIQKPQNKPGVALVFKGSKGTGKNALVERFGHLLNGHFMVTSNRRYLVSNFNGHLENNLLFVLDEAFWSGDKQAEGIMKDLITGASHVIEHKGKEQYRVDNLSRLVIIGNEDWLVPATQDERRYAVFEIGDGRKKDTKFFTEMRKGMEANGEEGYRHLLTWLSTYDLKNRQFMNAPDTQGLHNQKIASLEPLDQWWLECLTDNRIVGSDFNGWPKTIETERFRRAFERWCQSHNIRSRMPNATHFGRHLAKFKALRKTRQLVEGTLIYLYDVKNIAESQAGWDKYIGHSCDWHVDSE